MSIEDALGLPIVSKEAVAEYFRRRQDRQYIYNLIRILERENPILFHHLWNSNVSNEEERNIVCVALVQTYALLAIQYELDCKAKTN